MAMMKISASFPHGMSNAYVIIIIFTTTAIIVNVIIIFIDGVIIKTKV